ncbi:MAG TPA: alpha/beta family hydrolase [Ilumatobacteraceae bacterium]|nr:alpha/beta family hydrolase [Ilumatobacteraceae bacterium]
MAKPTVLLYPGAGSDRDQPSLVAIEQALGTTASVERLDFPYRKQGRRAPDRAPKLMTAIRDDLGSVRRRRGPVVMGGRSMGGRIASMVAADVDDVGPVARLAGLVLICYPLHPPGKPERLRVEHLVDLHVPCLFISGTRDPFGSPHELSEWTATIPAPVEHVWVEGGRHDLRGAEALIASTVAGFVQRLA